MAFLSSGTPQRRPSGLLERVTTSFVRRFLPSRHVASGSHDLAITRNASAFQ